VNTSRDQSLFIAPRRHMRLAIESALSEDIPSGQDLASESLFGPTDISHGHFLAKSSGILAGADIIELTYQALGAAITIDLEKHDGDPLEPGDVFARVEGPTIALLTGERTILNFMQRLSAIASLTHRFVKAVEGLGVRIADTRKTTPGLRALEKYAVRVGGGMNHRPDLSSSAMIKDNHLVGIQNKWDRISQARQTLGHWATLEVEVESHEDARRAVDAGADLVLLDNMDPATLKSIARDLRDQVTLEASGGITLDTVAAVARSGVHVISVGALTHSAGALDLSFELT